jgi:hypothetical protein
VGRVSGVLKTRDGRWEGMLVFYRLEMAGGKGCWIAGVLKTRDARWEGMLVFKRLEMAGGKGCWRFKD